MAYERKPNSGTLWVNDKKEKDSHADRKGDALIECPHCQAIFDVWVSGWIKEKQNGEKFLSLAVKVKEARRPQPPNPPPSGTRATGGRDEPEDDIPF